jgi:hypothetical protein
VREWRRETTDPNVVDEEDGCREFHDSRHPCPVHSVGNVLSLNAAPSILVHLLDQPLEIEPDSRALLPFGLGEVDLGFAELLPPKPGWLDATELRRHERPSA